MRVAEIMYGEELSHSGRFSKTIFYALFSCPGENGNSGFNPEDPHWRPPRFRESSRICTPGQDSSPFRISTV